MNGPVYKRMSDWENGTSLTGSINTIRHDYQNINGAFLKLNYPSAKTFCVVLGNDVQSANGNLPTPSPTVTLVLSEGYTDLYNGSVKCYEDAIKSDKTKLSGDLQLMKNGLDRIDTAVNLIKTIEKNRIG